jgi:D-amino peptidase
MKIMLMTDMEASAGILNHDDWVMRTGQFYEKGTRLLTEEVNAAINGFMSASCDLVVVIDGHGQGV